MIKGIAFQGGGITGIAHVGVLEVLEQRGILDKITHFVGASVGSIIASVLACKISVSDINTIIVTKNFEDFKDGGYWGPYNVYYKYGWYRGETLKRWLGDVFEMYCGNKDITFQEVYQRFGTFLEMPVSCVNTQSTVYLNHETEPNMPIREGIRRSAGLPIFFQAQQADNMMYIDGGLLNDYPIERLYKHLSEDECIGVRLISTQQSSPQKCPTSFEEYVWTVFSMTRNQALNVYISNDDLARTITIDIGDISITDFGLKPEQKTFLIEQGQKGAINFFE